MERREVRVGDRERREVDERLRAAHDDGVLSLAEYDERSRDCWAARFRGDLDDLLDDLPAAEAGTAPAAPTPAAAPVPAEESGRSLDRLRSWGGNLVGLAVAGALAFAVLGADQGAAVFGSRTVVLPPGQTEAEVGVLFGSTRVVVPEGVRATTSGLTIFGSTECRAACAAGGPAAPEVEVSGRGAFGSVEVLTPAEAASGVELGDD